MNELETRLRDALSDPQLDRRAPTRDEVLQRVRTGVHAGEPAQRPERQPLRVWIASAASAGVVAALVVATVVVGPRLGDGGGTEPTDGDRPAATGGPNASTGDWRSIAASPLQPRSGAVATWTGTEMVVFGGSTQAPCPPNASCIGPTGQEQARDGAAYDPDTDTWRRLAEAPLPITYATGTWTGSELVVLVPELTAQPAATLAYDPAADSWRRLPQPPAGYLFGEWTGERIVYTQSEERPGLDDWSLDPATGEWTRLPADPFGSTFDRSITWVGDRLVFTGLLTSVINSDALGVYQVAEFDEATNSWRRQDPSPVGFWDPNWFSFQGALVNPSQDVDAAVEAGDEMSPGGQLDLSTQQWAPIPQADIGYDQLQRGCQLPRIGVGASWLAGKGPILVSLTPADWVVVPDCPELAEPDVGVWADDRLIIWGGPDPDYTKNVNAGLMWTPPAPD